MVFGSLRSSLVEKLLASKGVHDAGDIANQTGDGTVKTGQDF